MSLHYGRFYIFRPVCTTREWTLLLLLLYQLVLAFELKSDSVAEEPFGRKEKNDPDRVFFPLTFYQCAVEYLQKKKKCFRVITRFNYLKPPLWNQCASISYDFHLGISQCKNLSVPSRRENPARKKKKRIVREFCVRKLLKNSEWLNIIPVHPTLCYSSWK